MWSILTDGVLHESFGIRLPVHRTPWGGPLWAPRRHDVLYLLDRHSSRQLKADICARYFATEAVRNGWCNTIFELYGLNLRDSAARERDGLAFLARQADHFCSPDDYLLIVDGA